MENVQAWAHTILMWIGFGTVVGLLAKMIMPGKDQGGPLANLLMGIAGTIVGMGTLKYFYDDPQVTPISLIGFITATGGSFVLLFVHRMLQGSFFRERGTGPTTTLVTPRRSTRDAVVVRQN